jgi:hypothetical protein
MKRFIQWLGERIESGQVSRLETTRSTLRSRPEKSSTIRKKPDAIAQNPQKKRGFEAL